MASRSRISLYVGVPVVVIVWLAFVIVLWRSGLLVVSPTKPEAAVVAAAVALVGAFLGTLVSLLGLILKHTLDEEAAVRLEKEAERDAALKARSEARLKLEGERNTSFQRDAERRLALEAGIKAVQLFANANGSAALPVQYSGALFTLASLGQHELTLSLTSFLLRGNGIEPETAASLINRALKAGSLAEQRTAITVLSSNVPKFFSPSVDTFPECVMDWEVGADGYVRFWAVVALAEAVLSRPVVDWQRRQFNANAVLAALGLAWLETNDEAFKTDVGAVLRWALVPFPNAGILFHPRRTVDMQTIARNVENAEPVGDAVIELVERLKTWASGGTAQPQPTTIATS